MDKLQQGMRVRRQVLGDDHVDRAVAATTPFTEHFQRFITETAWGKVWSEPQLTTRERSMITLGLLAALGHWREFEMHVRATRNTGATPEDIRETLMHVAVYAGVPAANHAFRIAEAVLADSNAESGKAES